MNPERRLSFKADNAGGFAEIVPEKMSEGFIERELSTGEYIVCGIEAESFARPSCKIPLLHKKLSLSLISYFNRTYQHIYPVKPDIIKSYISYNHIQVVIEDVSDWRIFKIDTGICPDAAIL